MSTTTRSISAVQSGTAYTADLNDAMAALDTCHSGSSAPTDEVLDGKFWLDTSGSNPLLKVYRSGWKTLFTLKVSSVDMSAGIVTGNTLVATTSVTAASAQINGNLTSTGIIQAVDVNTTSDGRLKDDIRTLESALDKVISLRGVSYTMQGVKKIGLIAQELEVIVPEVVSTSTEDGYKSVSYGNIVGLLVEAVKEQQKQIDELKTLLEK